MVVDCGFQVRTSGSRQIQRSHCRGLPTPFASVGGAFWLLVGELYLLCACIDQGAEALNSELGYMNTKGRASTRLARLAEVDKAVAIGKT